MPPLSQCARRYPIVRYNIRAFAIVLVGLIAASCSDNRLSQCKELIDVANQVVTDVQTVAQNASTTSTTSTTSPTSTASSTNNSSSDSVAVINKVAEAAEKARINMEALNLTDETLKNYQSQYAAMYTEINQTTRDMLTAAEAQNRDAGKEAYDAFRAATSREETLVQEINEYCAVQ